MHGALNRNMQIYIKEVSKMVEILEENEPQEKVIRVTYDGKTRDVAVSGTDRVEDIARAYGLDTRQYRFYDEQNGALDLGAFCHEVDGIRVIQNPKGAC